MAIGERINRMKLIFIRHGDPDYKNDCLTEKGRREADLLAGRFESLHADYCYISPLGRAQETAGACLKALEGTDKLPVETCDWLREFSPQVLRPNRPDIPGICWDWLPEDWTVCGELYDYNRWAENPVFSKAGVREEADRVYAEFEKLLNRHGYVSEGKYFRAARPNDDTIVFFCHFGITALLLSYLFKISPMVLWQSCITLTTSVTTVVTEERIEGKASFRMVTMGDVSHLVAGGEEPSFSGRFCEMYSNENERH